MQKVWPYKRELPGRIQGGPPPKKNWKKYDFSPNTPKIFAPRSTRRDYFKCSPPNLKSWIRPWLLYNNFHMCQFQEWISTDRNQQVNKQSFHQNHFNLTFDNHIEPNNQKPSITKFCNIGFCQCELNHIPDLDNYYKKYNILM